MIDVFKRSIIVWHWWASTHLALPLLHTHTDDTAEKNTKMLLGITAVKKDGNKDTAINTRHAQQEEQEKERERES